VEELKNANVNFDVDFIFQTAAKEIRDIDL